MRPQRQDDRRLEGRHSLPGSSPTSRQRSRVHYCRRAAGPEVAPAGARLSYMGAHLPPSRAKEEQREMSRLSVKAEENSATKPQRRTESPDPEVPEQAKRRRFSAKYKLRILREADACTEKGEIGALLRREGLYSSHLTTWRRQRDEGSLQGLAPKKRGRKPSKNRKSKREAQLEAEVRRLRKKLEQAETIIEIQKKVAALLGNPIESPESDEKS